MWSHQGFAGIMIFCIRAHTVDFECLARIDCVSVAMPLLRWIPQRIGPGFVHCLSLSRPVLNTSACNTSSVHCHSSSHCCQGDRIPLDFASVHQRVRDSTDEAHVYSEAESKVLVLCIVSIERRRLAQASQVLERLCIQRFGSGGHNRSQSP